ncbi:helix-turn-helix transcriptional regulator [Aquisalimonas lutea]|uniref:helix-turn-helix transcriptional regulator n=1 Tax=Aquisalimonas lutea TaxID=1327750 RepID=UPI00338E7D8A
MYLSNKEVQERYSISRTTIWRAVKEGRLPEPHIICGNLKRWKLQELEAWESR